MSKVVEYKEKAIIILVDPQSLSQQNKDPSVIYEIIRTLGMQPSIFLKTQSSFSDLNSIFSTTQMNGDMLQLAKMQVQQYGDGLKKQEVDSDVLNHVEDQFYLSSFEQKFFNILKKDSICLKTDLFHKGGLHQNDIVFLYNNDPKYSQELEQLCTFLNTNQPKLIENSLQEIKKCKISFIDLRNSSLVIQTQICGTLKEMKGCMKEISLYFITSSFQINNSLVFKPNLQLACSNHPFTLSPNHPLLDILPTHQSHDVFGPLQKLSESEQTKSGFLVYEFDYGNMRVPKSQPDDISSLIKVLQNSNPSIQDNQLLEAFPMRPQIIETLMKQIAFKIEKQSKFGA